MNLEGVGERGVGVGVGSESNQSSQELPIGTDLNEPHLQTHFHSMISLSYSDTKILKEYSMKMCVICHNEIFTLEFRMSFCLFLDCRCDWFCNCAD